MTNLIDPLDQSLRDGPPDEAGYRPRRVHAPDPMLGGERTMAVRTQRVRAGSSARWERAQPRWAYVAAALVVAIGFASIGIVQLGHWPGIGGKGSPASTVSPSPGSSTNGGASPLPPVIVVPVLSQTLVSARNGFSVQYPDGWTVTRASGGWPANAFLPYGHPALDTIVREGEARLMVASQPLSDGQTETQWLAAFLRPYTGNPSCGGDYTTWPRLDIDGMSGYLDMVDCPVPVDSKIAQRDVGFDALVFAGGRAYQIGFDGNVDLAYFKALLQTMRLDPARATN